MLNHLVIDGQLELGKRPLRRRRGLASTSGETADRTDKGTLRILIVDDEIFVAQNAASILESAGYEIVGMAVTAESVIEMAEELQPDLILMDISLLGPRDGIDAALEIRQRLGIRSLFISAYGDSETQARAAKADPVGFLSKPFTSETLLAGVKKIFD